ncbi:hypothetical protein [Agromyces humatus]|uniref:Uncharacterized protein n=1 Tax=Agromyces humatus TaxID=279573 RepID=A0ABN2KGH7_9MICO|nr:hypothetical protein [Agromyces humatus]
MGVAHQGDARHCLDVPFWFDHLDAVGVHVIAGETAVSFCGASARAESGVVGHTH